jgi:hypothetical protein
MSIFSHFPFRRQPRRKPIIRPRRLLNLEPLEDRSLLSGNVISGFVFNDLNNNGLFDPGEKGIANVPLELLNASGTVIGTAITDANGYYAFNVDNTISTAPMTLTRTASVSSTPTDWTKTLQVGQFDPSLGTLTAVDIINAGSITSEIKVENVDAAAATITATVSGSLTLSGSGFSSLVTNSSSSKTFNAGPFDGTVDFDDPSGHDFGPQTASGSMSFTITDPNALSYYLGTGSINLTEAAHATSAATGAGNLIAQISTTASAQISVVYHYIPSNSLKPGAYTIVQTSQPSGYLDGKLSSNGTVLPNSVGSHSITVTLGTSDLPHNDFAELTPASLSGYVYLDANNNGVKDPGESGIANVTITLTGTSDIGSVDLTTATAADGSYQLSNLRPGSYTITEMEPAGYVHGTDALGSLGGSIVNPLAMAVNLGVGANGTNYDFAELIPPNPTGMILADSFSTPANFASPLDVSILSKSQFLSFNSTLDPNVVAEAAFVDGLYRHVLGRPADPDSLVAWVQELQSGVSRAAVVDAVWNSPEHRGIEVDRLYQTFLNRSPDAAGRASWVQAMLAGASEMDVARALIDSAEFQADHPDNTGYVVALYNTILQRNPSGAELSSWTAALQNGVSRDSVALAFMDSAEAYQLMLNCDYTNILHRSPDPAGEQAWLSQLLSGSVSPATVSEAFLASDEFYTLARNAAGV